MSRRLIIIIVIALAIVGIVVYSLFDPAENLFPKCPFYVITGLKCPGCGSQRAIHQLLHFNILEAIRYNAFLVISIPVIVFLFVAELFKEKLPKIHRLSRNAFLSWGIVCAVLLWWILRNIFIW